MTTVTSDIAPLVESMKHFVPWLQGHLALNEGCPDAELLHCTRRSHPARPVDHFVVERCGRERKERGQRLFPVGQAIRRLLGLA